MQEFLERKKGLDVIDGEELFHQLYNPYFKDWKQKKQDYIKYNTLQRLEKGYKRNNPFRFNSSALFGNEDIQTQQR